MTPITEAPLPYLAFAALHLVVGQGLSGVIYRLRFGSSPLVLYSRRRSGGARSLHGRLSALIAFATALWAAGFVAFALSPTFRASLAGAALFTVPVWIGWLAGVVGLVGLVGMLAAQVGMGRAFRVGQDSSERPRLATGGLHRFSRNPIYVFSLLTLVAVSLWAPNLVVLLSLALLAVLIHRLILAEESFLEDAIGAPYRAYCDEVRRYV